MKTAIELWQKTIKHLKPMRKVSVSEWSDSFRQLSLGVSAEPGQWKTSRSEYTREVMNAFTDERVHRVTMMSAAQVGKTEVILNVIGRYAHLDPCPIMLIEPTEELMKDVSKSRIAGMIRDCKVLNGLFHSDGAKSRDSNQTILTKIFPGGRLVMCGANSPTNLASRSIKILLCDEVDRFPESAGSEGDPIEIAAKRTTTFWDSKIGVFSTPTVKDNSRIEDEYLDGSQEEWSHQCPNCHEFHVLEHKHMQVDYEVKKVNGRKKVKVKSVKWRCPDCGLVFDEKVMKSVPQKYIMKNELSYQKGHRSFFINGFASCWVDWKNIYEEYYKAEGQPKKEQVVYNTRFGQAYKFELKYVEEDKDVDREDYGAEIPLAVNILTAAVDVQDNRLECEVCGWSDSDDCYGIGVFRIAGIANQALTWSMLDSILDKDFLRCDGKALKVSRTFIDSGGHFTSSVYEYCRRNIRKQRIAIKGYGGNGATLLHKTTLIKKYGLLLQIIGVNEGKEEVMTRLMITDGEQKFHFPNDLKSGYDKEYFKQLQSEKQVEKIKQGIRQRVWTPISKKIRNEALDLRVYNLACYESLKAEKKKVKKEKMSRLNLWR